MSEALVRPYDELFINSNTPRYNISQDLLKLGYPYGYDLLEKKIVNNEGLVDSAKSVRAILWNSISIVSTIITNNIYSLVNY
jgi:chaperonin GroEL (HSP60 family)